MGRRRDPDPRRRDEDLALGELQGEQLDPLPAHPRGRPLREPPQLEVQGRQDADRAGKCFRGLHASILPRIRPHEPLPAVGYPSLAMLVAITGGTGFIGQYLIKRLLDDGHQVRALCRPGRETALEAHGREGLQIHTGDLTDAGSLEGFLAGARYCVHLASAHDHFTEEQMQAVNVTGSEHLMAEARNSATPQDLQFVIISSAVIGVPVYSYYRDSKRVQEKIFRGSEFPWVSFRPTLVYGVGDHRHTAPLLRRCAAPKGSYWVPHEGLSKLNPVHVDDLIDAVVRFFGYERGQEDYRVFEIAGPYGISFNDFVDTVIEVTGGGVKRRNVPRRWVERAITFLQIFKDMTKQRRGAGYFSLHHEHDIRPAQEELGWEPRPFTEGIRDVAAGDWWREDRGSGQATSLGTGGV